MKKLLISLFGLFFLTACGGTDPVPNDDDDIVPAKCTICTDAKCKRTDDDLKTAVDVWIADLSVGKANSMEKYGKINEWDTSGVKKMNQLFSGKANFNEDISCWQTDNVTTMQTMFYQAAAFNKNINDWNTQNVNNMISMFNGATAFNQPLEKWNVENVTTFRAMFYSATTFNQNLNTWKDKLKNGLQVNIKEMFNEATAYTNKGEKLTWDLTDLLHSDKAFTGSAYTPN